jgi:L-alanine-DL-glutamate epimerase-like enolase superfamily enzyme
VTLGALTVAAALGAEVRTAAEGLQVAQVVVAAQDHVPAATAVAAVRAALGDVRLAPEGHGAVAALPGEDLDPRAVVQHQRPAIAGSL